MEIKFERVNNGFKMYIENYEFSFTRNELKQLKNDIIDTLKTNKYKFNQAEYSRKFRKDLKNKEYNRRTALRYNYINKSCNVFYKNKIYPCVDYIDAIKFIYLQNDHEEYEIKSFKDKLISNNKDINIILDNIDGINATEENLIDQIKKSISNKKKRWNK